ncbi:hypothetical protein PIB30_061361 [Stylosanthes scabra]|uniref:Uncharacterized protein n=1 Tax=Stylosanthes scabra TaxID=79078 RepID=A0ABU6TKM1_9FABA|nr:hypothetical protein [Stylosanthes scabra]
MCHTKHGLAVCKCAYIRIAHFICALAFDLDYARWVEEHQSLIGDLRSALSSQMGDNELDLLVDGVLAHYDELLLLVDGVLHVYVATYSSIH